MSISQAHLEVEKFNGHNFELWKLNMEGLLIDRDLWHVIEDPKPMVEETLKAAEESKLKEVKANKMGSTRSEGTKHD
ncbi:hypothetical protein Patl1_28254 [Pistacia atlantica]|uniref:Uncharacterized protein n=1 Tax=Pistacia atlantica TaxID=434234 RepID=A0ACC1BEG9_9ROSI|nr:hypothetical protein Patl1_28254 [Pistacia atlantica]